ncbi:hypothetical protein [Corynebacterium sp.]|uniref:hypothetical protein n=1 Tax=Corynebacterium sp. TaxID=1720 RepID=UPI0028B00713|nr:hypothetical protein [Corynebacterium sp.]
MTTHTMPLSFTRPPLSANDRSHWRPRARITRAVRHEAATRARAMRLGPYRHITVQLHYRPRDRRVRDASNIMPTQKALVDGLRDARVVPDDDGRYVTEQMPTIYPVDGPAAMWLTIETQEPR